jgi:hypothetical protein
MRRLTATTALVAAVAGCWASAANGELRGQYATQTFVIARYIETRAVNTVLNTGLARMEAQASQISGECSGVLLHAPTGTNRRTFSVELEFSIVLALFEPLREPIDGFTGAMVADRLRWHDKRLQRLVYAYVREQASFVALHPPDICNDAREWAASGYTTLPSGTKRFATELGRSAHSTEPQLMSVLLRHTTRSERVVLARTAGLEASQSSTVTPRLTAAVHTAADALGAPAIGPVVVHATGRAPG